MCPAARFSCVGSGRTVVILSAHMAMGKARKLSSDAVMWACIAAAFLFFFHLAYQKYAYFNGETNDLTIFAYAFAQTFKGRFLPVYFSPGNLMGLHPNIILALWLPVYAVWRSFYSLLFYESVMLTISAWPLYL